MLYGEAKRRSMSRSILPSTRRKGARLAKRDAHKTTRARVRAALRNDFDDEADVALDAQRYTRYRGIKIVVSERRDADKVAPLMRWAEAKADDLGDTPQERSAALRAMLPPNIIGWHAMTHVDTLDEYRFRPSWWWRYGNSRTTETHESRRTRLCDALYGRLDRVGELNRKLKYDHAKLICEPEKRPTLRLWHGAHDIEDFATWVLTQSRYRHGYADLTTRGPRLVVSNFCDLPLDF